MHIDEPRPKKHAKRALVKPAWNAYNTLSEVKVSFQCTKSFDDILENRRTCREIKSASLAETLGFIKHIFEPRQIGSGSMINRLRKPMISAGALHPIDVIVIDGPEIENPILFSDTYKKFVTLTIKDNASFSSALKKAKHIQPNAKGHLMLFAGDKDRVAHNYHNPESLLWRDSGAAAQICASAAFAYGYNYCPLGVNGTTLLDAIGPPNSQFIALGLSIFGN